jgi:hypothetical protein
VCSTAARPAQDSREPSGGAGRESARGDGVSWAFQHRDDGAVLSGRALGDAEGWVAAVRGSGTEGKDENYRDINVTLAAVTAGGNHRP